jgi:hypothetical protein
MQPYPYRCAGLPSWKHGRSLRIAHIFTFACLALFAIAGLSGQAFATTYAVVYPAGSSCTPPNPPSLPTASHTFNTIQSAVSASRAATTIQICPGTYTEQVAIDKNLTLEGVAGTTQDAVVIVPPAGGLVANTLDFDNTCIVNGVPTCPNGFPTAAQILVVDSAVVSISNLTVDGTGSNGNGVAGCGPPDVVGILFQNASGTVNHVAVRNQLVDGNTISGCQAGLGIFVQTATSFTSTVTVENSSVHNYNKNGITGNDPGTKLTVTGNYVQGSGPASGVAAQNGIQLGFGATGKINNNTVIDNLYTDPAVAAASDILLYDSAEYALPVITVSDNTVGNSQLPIGLETLGDDGGYLGDGVTVSGNKVFGTGTYDAIDVCTNGNMVTGNTIVNTANSGVHFDDGCGAYFGGITGTDNDATGNTIVESECAGLLDDWNGEGGNTYGTETYYTVPFPLANDTTIDSCPYIAGEIPARRAKPKTAHKFRPAR